MDVPALAAGHPPDYSDHLSAAQDRTINQKAALSKLDFTIAYEPQPLVHKVWSK
jgi:hypothetical protein